LQAADGSAYTIYSQYANKDENGVAIPSERMQGVTFSSNMVMLVVQRQDRVGLTNQQSTTRNTSTETESTFMLVQA
jgi:hypothetical protein